MEGVGHHRPGALEQAQKLPGPRVEHQLPRPLDPPPGPRQLDDGPAGALRQGQGVGGRLAGVGDEVAQDVGPLEFGGHGQLSPVLPGEQEGGVQHHPGLTPGHLLQQHLAPALPHGEGGVGGQVFPQLLRLVRRQLGHPQAGGVGDLPSPGEGQQEGRVELLVLKNIGIPDLVAARHVHVVLRRGGPELFNGGVALRRQGHLLRHKGLKPLKPALEGGVVQGGMGVGSRPPQAAPPFEYLVGAGGVGQAVIDDLAVPAQALDGPHGGVGLELGPVVVGEMEGDQSGAHGAPP